MSYLLLIEDDEITYLINLMSDMFEATDSVNVIKILSSEENKCIFNESQTLK